MTIPFIDALNEIFEDADTIDGDKIQRLMEETGAILSEMEEKLSSNDPKVKEEVQASAIEIKRALEAQMQKISEKSGLDLSLLNSLGENIEPIAEMEEFKSRILNK